MKHLYQIRYQIGNSKRCHNVVADSPSDAIGMVEENMQEGSEDHMLFELCKAEKTLQVITIARVDIS